MKHLILGGARSGKSKIAEDLAIATGKQLHYIATGWAGDGEMSDRIAHHKARRSEQWTLIEEPIKLAEALTRVSDKGNAVVIDCLTLWLCNCMTEECVEAEKLLLLQAVEQTEADIFIVSNEVGSGVVPLGNLPRVFVDESGWIHQGLAAISDRVSLVVAGLPLSLKGD